MVKPIDQMPGFKPKREEFKLENGHVRIEVTPPEMFALPTQSVVLSADQYVRYRTWYDEGKLIQNALPDLSIVEREILMSGLGNEDFLKMAGDEDDE